MAYRTQENFSSEKVWRIKTTGRLAKKLWRIEDHLQFDLAKAPRINSHIHNEDIANIAMQRRAI